MAAKRDPQPDLDLTGRPAVLAGDQPGSRRYDSLTGRPLAPEAATEPALGFASSRRVRPFSRRILVRDLLLVLLHLGVYVVVVGGILYQLRFIGSGPVTIRYSSFDAVFWPGWVWGTLIAAQAGAAFIQRRRWLGAVLGAMASVLLGTWLLGRIDEYMVAAIVFRSVAVALAALAVAVSLLRRPPDILTAERPTVVPGSPTVPTMAVARRPGLVSIPNVLLSVFALVFVLGAIGHGTYRALEVQGSGILAERQIDVALFSRIDVRGSGILVVRPGAEPEVTVRGDDNLLDAVRVATSDGELALRFDPGGRGPASVKTPLTWVVTVPELQSLSVAGDVDVTIDPGLAVGSLRVVASDDAHVRLAGLAANALSVAARDNATMDLVGRTRTLSIDASSGSVVEGRGLVSDDATVGVRDDATVRLGETTTLTYWQSGLASILCQGSPAIDPTSQAVVPQCAVGKARLAS